MNLINVLLQEAVEFQLLNTEDALTVALYPTSGNFIDVRGKHRFGFILMAGALDTQTTLQVQQAAAANGTPKDVTGALLTVGATGDDKFYIVEVGVDRLDTNNGYGWVTASIAGPTGNDYGALLFFAIGDKIPVDNGATEGALVAVVG